ncbi:MAG: lipopolysaccharide biosynthesis protein [Pirellulaceae bacterium]
MIALTPQPELDTLPEARYAASASAKGAPSRGPRWVPAEDPPAAFASLPPAGPAGPATFGRSATWAFAGNAGYRIAQWAMLAALAKWATAETVGQFGLALAVCNPVMMMAYLQLGSVMASDATRSVTFQTYFALRATTATVAVLTICCATLLIAPLHSAWPVILVMAIAKYVEAQSDIYQGVLKQADRMDVWAVLQLARAAFSFVLFVSLFFWTRSLVAAISGLAGTWVVLLVVLDRPVANRYGIPAVMRTDGHADTIRRMRELSLATLPLGLISLLIALYAYFPQYLVEASRGVRDLGLFVVVASVPLVLETVVRSAGQAALPRLGKAYHAGDQERFWQLYRQTFLCFLSLGLIGLGLVWLFGRHVLTIAFAPEFAAYSDLLLWLMAGAAISFLTSYGPVFLAFRRYNVFLLLWLIALAILVLFAFLLIPPYGVYGAAAAIVVANTARCIMVHAAIYSLTATLFAGVPDRTDLTFLAHGHT